MRDFKNLKTVSMPTETMQQKTSKPYRRFLGHWEKEKLNYQKFFKIALEKMLNFVILSS